MKMAMLSIIDSWASLRLYLVIVEVGVRAQSCKDHYNKPIVSIDATILR